MSFLKWFFGQFCGFFTSIETAKLQDRMHARQFHNKERFTMMFMTCVIGIVLCVVALFCLGLNYQGKMVITNLLSLLIHCLREMYYFEFGQK